MSLQLLDENALRDRKATVVEKTATVRTLAVCDENAENPPRKTPKDPKACQAAKSGRTEAAESQPKPTQPSIRRDNPPAPCDLEDIDADDSDYLEFCSVYVKSIYDHLFESETKFAVRADFLRSHPEVIPRMRMCLIEWLVTLQNRFKLLQDTLLLSVSIMDRTLSSRCIKINRANFQLLGK